MKLREIYRSKKPVISFEIFPPKADESEIQGKIDELFHELKELSEFNPSFISVTYGAGGSTRERTLELVLKIKNELNISPMPHFTCVGATRDEILHYIKVIENADIKNILALRGDPPKGETKFVKPADGFGYANELVEFIRSNTDLGIAVAGYPEGHQECESLDKDIENLKRKVDAGADIVITQLFYDVKFYFEFLEKAQKAGINIPIIPGILPVISLSQIERIKSMSTAKVPDEFMSKLIKYQDDKDVMKEIGLEHTLNNCKELLKNEVPGLHLYTFNKASATKAILKELDLSCEFNRV